MNFSIAARAFPGSASEYFTANTIDIASGRTTRSPRAEDRWGMERDAPLKELEPIDEPIEELYPEELGALTLGKAAAGSQPTQPSATTRQKPSES